MKRLFAAISYDLLFQFRKGGALLALSVLAGSLGFALHQAAANPDAPLWFFSLNVVSFLPAFVALCAYALSARAVWAEKRSGSLAYLELTPLRPHEYLLAKAKAVAIASLFPSFLLAAALQSSAFRWIYFVIGVSFVSTFSAWAGFLAAAYARRAPALFLTGALFTAALCPMPIAPNPDYPGWHLAPSVLDAWFEASFGPASPPKLAVASAAFALLLLMVLIASRRAFSHLRAEAAGEAPVGGAPEAAAGT